MSRPSGMEGRDPRLNGGPIDRGPGIAWAAPVVVTD